MAHSYSHLYGLPTTGLRFFTVYGPYDRPDMALQKFAQAILDDKPIKVFNYGKHRRDFTFIDDIVEGISRALDVPANQTLNGTIYCLIQQPSCPYKIYNIGNNSPVKIMDYIEALEFHLGKKATKELMPIQPGDVQDTFADIDDFIDDFNYRPMTSIMEGVKIFADWYKKYTY